MPHSTSAHCRHRSLRRGSLSVLAVATAIALVSCATAPARTANADPSNETSAAQPTRAVTGSARSTQTSSTPERSRTASSPRTSSAPTRTSTSTSTPPKPKPPVRSCAELAAALTTNQQIGQLLMVGIGSGGLTTTQASILTASHAGSVILLGNSTAGASSIKRLSRRVHSLGGKPSGVSVMLTVDQEGGKVQRLRGSGFDRIPSAKSQARLSSATLTSRSRRWSQQLHAAGIDANLAPVADLVPKNMEKVNQPVGVLQRGYGPNPDVVAAKVTAFVSGMHRGGTASAVKHFPGLGRVRGNTDFTTRVVDTATTRHDRGLKGFKAGVNAGVDMVMVSSAIYNKIDPRHRAAFSKVIIGGMIRGDLGYGGVVISDDLSARVMQDLSPAKRAVTFLGAGGDLIIVGNSATAPAMVRGIKSKAAVDPKFRADVLRKATRVLQMKANRGLAGCR